MRHSPGARTVRVDRPGGVSASVFRRFRPRRSLLRRGFSFGPEVAGLPGRMSVGRQLERMAGLRSARTNGAADVDGANGAGGTVRAVRRSGTRPESFRKKDRNASAACINEELEVLLKKYDYNVPSLSEQKINDCIKLVCEHVSKTVPSLCKRERTRLTKTERELLEKGKREFEFDAEGYPVKPRWELVCCHTARRTAITNMYLSGKFSTRQIMSVSGHKKEDTFLKYIRLSLDEKADDVASAASDGLF